MNPLQATTTGLEPASELVPRTTPGRPSAPAAVALLPPLMAGGGCLLTVSYYGAEKVVDHYNMMGPVKAGLEGTVRYLAAELGPKGIRVNALSPGPLKTRAASGIDHFDALIDDARARAPERRLVTIAAVGAMATGLVSEFARNVTGNIAYVDAGYHVMS